MEMPTVHKDLSLISLVPKCTGAEMTTPLEDFLSSIEGADRTWRWNDMDCHLVEILRSLNLVKAFYNSSLELHAEYMT